MSNPSTAVGVWVAELSQADRLGVRNLLLWVMKKSGRPKGKLVFVFLGGFGMPNNAVHVCSLLRSRLEPPFSPRVRICVCMRVSFSTCSHMRSFLCVYVSTLVVASLLFLSLSLFVFDSGLSVYDTPS